MRIRLSIGHLNKTLGRRSECEEAYKLCLEIDPGMGEAYWSLADLKNYVFSDAEIATMQALLKGEDGDDEDQAQLHSRSGARLSTRSTIARAFEHYAIGNARRRKTVAFDIEAFENKTRRVRECFDAAFFAPRSGSRMMRIPRRSSSSACRDPVRPSSNRYSPAIRASKEPSSCRMCSPWCASSTMRTPHTMPTRKTCAALPLRQLALLGRRYIEETAPIRSGRPHFIDKMPNNFSHVGLIHAMLPGARIIDVRRHPMDACFSTYKQYFAEGQSFSYDLDDLGRYYRVTAA